MSLKARCLILCMLGLASLVHGRPPTRTPNHDLGVLFFSTELGRSDGSDYPQGDEEFAQLCQALAESEETAKEHQRELDFELFGPPQIKLAASKIETPVPSDSACAICLDSFEQSQPIKPDHCDHLYHEQCLLKWAQIEEYHNREVGFVLSGWLPLSRAHRLPVAEMRPASHTYTD
jgi:hypothetical protein